MVRAALAVVALVALTGGCVGLFGSVETPTPVTPVPVTDQPAPGVPASGIGEASQVGVDADRLLAANDRLRAAESYTLRRRVVVRGTNDSLRIQRLRQVGTDGRILERLSANGTGSLTLVVRNGTLWENGSSRWMSVRLSDGRTLKTELLSLEGSPFDAGRSLPRRVVTGTDFAVESTGDGAVLRSTDGVAIAESDLPIPVENVRNGTAVVVVAEDGFVRAVNLTYDATLADERVTVTITHRIVDRGTTATSRPDWVPDGDDAGNDRLAGS